ncbi:TenA family protein [Bifidobacterium sp.]|uniref:TenA family protein n=1 Tax=Bifidobacterium sp. TaxID=41200 RepID=UPI0039ED2F39
MTAAYETCKSACSEEWDAAVNHRFNRELVSDTLDDKVLRKYLIQDWQYTDGFYSLLGQAVASADRLESKIRLGRQLGFIANDEDSYFRDRFRQFKVTPAELDRPTLTPSSVGMARLYADTVDTRRYAEHTCGALRRRIAVSRMGAASDGPGQGSAPQGAEPRLGQGPSGGWVHRMG